MIKLRLRFKKTGKAKYLSHLDLMRTLQRVFQRAGLEVKHSEGFNPHARIVIAVPLSLGYESLCELLDFELVSDTIPDDIIDKLNSAMPSGINVTECYEPSRKFKEITWIKYELQLFYWDSLPQMLKERLNAVFSRNELVVKKRSKRDEKETDISKSVKNVIISETDDGVLITAYLTAGEAILNPSYLIEAIKTYEPELTPLFVKYRRIENLDKELKIFR